MVEGAGVLVAAVAIDIDVATQRILVICGRVETVSISPRRPSIDRYEDARQSRRSWVEQSSNLPRPLLGLGDPTGRLGSGGLYRVVAIVIVDSEAPHPRYRLYECWQERR